MRGVDDRSSWRSQQLVRQAGVSGAPNAPGPQRISSDPVLTPLGGFKVPKEGVTATSYLPASPIH